ncbi:uncharacterized protein MONOS_6291 [Monocercomonoides exilis]|uniref:uncharacterized protein n=1 Tax=Monocercomonoides exilis TaxID=2049356 RepID=UPI0035597EF4|nr:hypothetical protein MONOS_6291 [Monocercomonoides exilis]|eukprot:MONOS_6291.1-p1 / transcript=MONOS_6291.1 / gene=MONOS_6291 / organism=Monocercomonoides_exilis_PA203 / gene_product=unspecified product / transcript_product=unspecified product / location=Mono_scaffold00196:26647-30557(-) / protein_length=1182 / sequence_SO=supercontig / SO=protein_coding / is_pseudo=false
MCSFECVSSLEGTEGMVMKIQSITQFELIRFAIPSSFTIGVNYLMHVGSSEGLLTVKDCSFTKKGDDREEVIHYGLIKAEGGSVVLDFVTIQLLSFSQDVISVLPTTTLNIKNLTMKNVELDGASGLNIAKSSRREKNEIEQDVVIEWSSFEEVTQNTTNDIPIIRNDNDEPLKMVIRNTTMKKCGGTRCGKGGGMFCVLNEGGNFDCSFCTISECFCSSTGRGGWLFLECTTVVEQPLNFVLLNITFRDNSALRGRDVYVRCRSIDAQIVEEQFLLDFRTPFVKELAMWGCTTDSFVDEEDLLLRIVIYQSEAIFVSSVADNHTDSKQCGEFNTPCQSMSEGVTHIIPSFYSQLLISEESIIKRECDARDLTISSLQSPSGALAHLNSTINFNEGSLLTTLEKVRIERLKFNFGQSFSYSGSSIIHEASGELSLSFVDFSSVGESENIEAIILNSTLLSVENGILHIDNCSLSLLSFKKPSFVFNGEEISLTNMKLEQIESIANVFELGQCGSVVFDRACANGVKLSEGCILEISSSTSGTIFIGSTSFKNCSRNSEGTSVLSASSSSAEIVLLNCSCESCNSLSSKGSIMEMNNAKDVSMQMCEFEGMVAKESEAENDNAFEEICEWNGSLVHSENSDLQMVEIKIENSSKGGISIKGGKTVIEMGMLANNNPFIEKYPSLRRNIICSDSASLTISSLKGGDRVMPNFSLWILNDGCSLGGIAEERASPFFIPVLESVETREKGEEMEVIFKGKLLPCNLSFRLVYKTGDVEFVETFEFEENSFVLETEVIGTIPSDKITTVGDETEVSVVISWRKAKNEAKDLREIVNDTVRKDPKLIEMTTMEPSPEEQWRRAEREAEKKNEERIKKRVYKKSLGHSESSEHLLSESGSTEYILGKDSDKIPEWALENVDEKEEEEETRKRTPSPSISSTSTTDSDSTFVRSESLCPTTSSMSNLVDVMACSSPHEKLIVDLRDSLFMLLHGRNEKKEMAIGNDDSDSSSISSSTVVASASDDDDDDCDSLPSSAFEDEDNFRKECLMWKAPELLMNKKMRATKKSVAFSIGMMLWECLKVEIPFGEYAAEVAGQKMANHERPDICGVKESQFFEIIRACLSAQPEDRLELTELKREFIQRFPREAVMVTISDAIDQEETTEMSDERASVDGLTVAGSEITEESLKSR